MTRDERARERAVEEIGRIATAGVPAPEIYRRTVAVLDRVMDVAGACFQLSDPLTGVPVSEGAAGSPPGTLARSLHYEYERGDVSRFGEIQARPRPLAVLSQETAGRPRESPRFREMIEPEGGSDELRVAFADAFGVWGTMVIFAARERYEERDADLVARIVPALAQGLRVAPRPGAATADEGPGVIVLDDTEQIELADPRALAHLRALGVEAEEALPAAFAVLCAWARLRDPERPARARARAGDGRWLTVDVTPLDAEPHGRLAIVIQPASGGDVLEAAMRSIELTAREREVAGLLIAGRSNKEIATMLHLSPHTVGDHLKAIFEKSGARSRGEVATRVLAAALA